MKLLVAEGTNAHQDEDFNDYVNIKYGEPTYTVEEAALRNALTEQCFDVCKIQGGDIYDIMQDIFLKDTGLDQQIPVPSQIR